MRGGPRGRCRWLEFSDPAGRAAVWCAWGFEDSEEEGMAADAAAAVAVAAAAAAAAAADDDAAAAAAAAAAADGDGDGDAALFRCFFGDSTTKPTAPSSPGVSSSARFRVWLLLLLLLLLPPRPKSSISMWKQHGLRRRNPSRSCRK